MKMVTENKTELFVGILVVLISIIVGTVAHQIGATLSDSVVVSLFTSILGLLFENRRVYGNLKKDTLTEIKRCGDKMLAQIGTFGRLNESLLEIEKAKSQSDWTEPLPILQCLDENIHVWSQRVCSAQELDQKILWLKVLSIYLKEEGKDLKARRLSTNVDIYVNLLMQTIRYYIEHYGEEAVIIILTSVLPRDWYEWPSANAFEQERVYTYRNELASYIKEKRKNNVVPNFHRYIILSELNKCFQNKKNLFCQDQTKYFEKYIDELHFDGTQASFFISETVSSNFHENHRDLLLFGRSRGDRTDWRWAIESNMDPGFPVMFVKFYDSETIKEPAAFVGYDVDTFVNAIRGKSTSLGEKFDNYSSVKVNPNSA